MRWLGWFLFLGAHTLQGTPTDSLSRAADYYYFRQDYRQALRLWEEVVKKDLTSISGVLRLADLKLVVEGKRSALASLVDVLQSKSNLVTHSAKSVLTWKLSQVLTLFES